MVTRMNDCKSAATDLTLGLGHKYFCAGWRWWCWRNFVPLLNDLSYLEDYLYLESSSSTFSCLLKKLNYIRGAHLLLFYMMKILVILRCTYPHLSVAAYFLMGAKCHLTYFTFWIRKERLKTEPPNKSSPSYPTITRYRLEISLYNQEICGRYEVVRVEEAIKVCTDLIMLHCGFLFSTKRGLINISPDRGFRRAKGSFKFKGPLNSVLKTETRGISNKTRSPVRIYNKNLLQEDSLCLEETRLTCIHQSMKS